MGKACSPWAVTCQALHTQPRPLHRPISPAERKETQRGHPTLAQGHAGLTREGGIHGVKHFGPPNMPPWGEQPVWLGNREAASWPSYH